MNAEQIFYRVLGDTPDLPVGVFGSVESAIRRHAIMRIGRAALAAVVVAAAGIIPFVSVNGPSGEALRPEVELELLTVRNFLNGGDIEAEFERYAFVEGY